MIEGVAIKKLRTHRDERGFFRELIRETDDFFTEGFGQLSHSQVEAGVVKAWHAHREQTQWNYPATGLLQVVLHDARPDSVSFGEKMEFLCGEGQPEQVYAFPPGVLHGYRVLSGPVQMIYMTSGTYDLADEIRIPETDPAVGYDWGA
jgi:dTDP-4-dehydrorhamnose 3,5-epimerase